MEILTFFVLESELKVTGGPDPGVERVAVHFGGSLKFSLLVLPVSLLL